MDFDSSMANEAGAVQDIAAALQVPGWFASEGNNRNTAMAKTIMEVTRYEFTKSLVEVRRHSLVWKHTLSVNTGAGRGLAGIHAGKVHNISPKTWLRLLCRVTSLACVCAVSDDRAGLVPLFFLPPRPPLRPTVTLRHISQGNRTAATCAHGRPSSSSSQT